MQVNYIQAMARATKAIHHPDNSFTTVGVLGVITCEYGNRAQQAWGVEVECIAFRQHTHSEVCINLSPVDHSGMRMIENKWVVTVRLGQKTNKPPPSSKYFQLDWRERRAWAYICERKRGGSHGL